jgi:methylated-DNA-[protein]-cysteine S-methyltransferase
MNIERVVVHSLVGPWGVEGNALGVSRIVLPHELPHPSAGLAAPPVLEMAEALEAYFAGRRPTFDVPRVQAAATDFQSDCWRALETIAHGDVRTYGEVALMIGRPRAARAIGNAVHVNPWPIVVPCHRVVASNGIGGYGGGVAVKEYLLELEQR